MKLFTSILHKYGENVFLTWAAILLILAFGGIITMILHLFNL